MELKHTFTNKRLKFVGSVLLTVAVLQIIFYTIDSFLTVDTANMNDETFLQHLNTTQNELTIMEWVVFRVNMELNNINEDNKPLHAMSMLEGFLPNKYVHYESVRFLPDETLFEGFVVFTEQPFMSLSPEDQIDAIDRAYLNMLRLLGSHLRKGFSKSKYKSRSLRLERYLKVRFMIHNCPDMVPMVSRQIAVIKDGKKLHFSPGFPVKEVRQ